MANALEQTSRQSKMNLESEEKVPLRIIHEFHLGTAIAPSINPPWLYQRTYV